MKLVEINFHGRIGKKLGKSRWGLYVSSVSEALHAVNKMSGGKLFVLLGKEQKKNSKFKILINDDPYKADSDVRFDEIDEGDTKKTKKQFEAINNSSLRIESNKLEKIDIVPVVEGADDIGAIFTIFIAIMLIVIGIILWTVGGYYLVMAGVALLAAGISALLMDPPDMKELRTLEGATSASYLFNGPVNIIREGGPVPVCYGQLLCGSQTLAAYYDIDDVAATENSLSN